VARQRRDDAHADVALARRRLALRRLLVRERRPQRLPDVREGAFELRDGGAADLDARVAPRRHAPRRVAGPHAADAESRHEADAPVDGQHLAVVARDPAERRGEARRVVAAHLDASRPQLVPESRRGLADPAEPVVHEAHLHALARPRDERRCELLAHLVVVDDVALEVDASPRAADRFEPRRIVLARVFEQADAVALDERRPRGPRERLVCERAHEVRVVSRGFGRMRARFVDEDARAHRPA
jgi:hypothetical protein